MARNAAFLDAALFAFRIWGANAQYEFTIPLIQHATIHLSTGNDETKRFWKISVRVPRGFSVYVHGGALAMHKSYRMRAPQAS